MSMIVVASKVFDVFLSFVLINSMYGEGKKVKNVNHFVQLPSRCLDCRSLCIVQCVIKV